MKLMYSQIGTHDYPSLVHFPRLQGKLKNEEHMRHYGENIGDQEQLQSSPQILPSYPFK